MKYSRKDITIGSNINGWIITSEIYCEKKNNNYVYYVEAKCRECGEIRKVRVSDIQNGKSTKCSYCHTGRRCINHYQTFGKYTILVIENKTDNNKYKFIFDTKFKDEIMKHYWGYIETCGNIYARDSDSSSNKNNNIERLHRFICELEYGKEKIQNMIIDHKNRNTFDTRLENLNIVTPLENAQNANIRKDNTSGVKGVNWCKRFEKWHARIQFNNKRIGKYFDTFEEAVEWRKEKEIELHKYVQENYKEN